MFLSRGRNDQTDGGRNDLRVKGEMSRGRSDSGRNDLGRAGKWAKQIHTIEMLIWCLNPF